MSNGPKISEKLIIIVVIITWPKKKCQQKDEHDIRGFRTAHWSKWLNFMQNIEHDVTVST